MSHGDPHYRTPAVTWIVLACLGAVDLVRGFMHTFLVRHSAVEIAGLNLAHSGPDQLTLLGAFGISNFLTGAIILVVAFKARHLAPTILALIPLTYLLGLVAFRLNHVVADAPFPGRKFMLVYLGVCVLTFAACQIYNLRLKRRARQARPLLDAA